jgi:hypothetical protein
MVPDQDMRPKPFKLFDDDDDDEDEDDDDIRVCLGTTSTPHM